MTGKTRVLRGVVDTTGTTNEGINLLDGSRKGYAYKVTGFRWWCKVPLGTSFFNGNNTGIAYLSSSKNRNPVSFGLPDLSSPTQFAWTWNYAPSDFTITTMEHWIDPTHMVYDELYLNMNLQNFPGAGNFSFCYFVVLEEMRVDANEQILYQLQEDSQNEGSDD